MQWQREGLGMSESDLDRIEITPIGYVHRRSIGENVRDRSLISEIVLNADLIEALEGIDAWSHIYIIYWLDRVEQSEKPVLRFPSNSSDKRGVGVLATRAPIHPNPIGLTLVELINREGNVLRVQGLDAYDGTPVLDIKPYPDWEAGRLIVVTDFKVPEWLHNIIARHD
jgi:tRNA-Thr(GGU) m(6)t(6)A37 methyltransferase TsaA